MERSFIMKPDDWSTAEPTVKVGQKVRLNNQGMQNITGLDSWKQIEQARCMTITRVDPGSLCTDQPVHYIEVDQPLINKFILTSKDVEAI